MAQQILGADGSTVVKVDPTFGALRYSPRPLEASVGWYQVSARSGALTGLTAGQVAFVFRQIGTNLILVRKVQVGFIATTGFTAAQWVDFAMVAVRNWTVSDTNQTAVDLTGTTNRLRTSFSSLTSVSCRISNTGAITGGTKSADANYMGYYGQWFTTAAGQGFGMTTIFDQGPGEYPLVLNQNEGFQIVAPTAMGAGGVGYLTVMVELAETAPSNYP